MKKFLFLTLLTAVFAFNACKDDDTTTDEPDYHAHIESPDTSDKLVGDMLHIHVNFEDHNGGTVHHINVRIYNKDTNVEIYNKPTSAHVHAEGEYLFEDEIELTTAGHWVLEAKVWGHDDGVAEVVESVEFHVN